MTNILIIEDEDDIRELMAKKLELAGYSVQQARDGKEGQLIYQKRTFDIVITDIVMAEMTGIEVIMDLRKNFPAIKIIAISGGGSNLEYAKDYLKVAKGLGAIQIFQKPCTSQMILEAIDQIASENGAVKT